MDRDIEQFRLTRCVRLCLSHCLCTAPLRHEPPLWLADIAREVQYKYIRLPYLSVSSIRDCMDKGRDTMMPTPFCENGITDRAVIDVADSLIAVKKTGRA